MGRGSLKLLLFAVVAVIIMTATGTASAAGGYYVTFVARACPSYGDIYADGARNDSNQSLEDLEPNSRYDRSRALVTPRSEEMGLQLRCKPLRNWVFTLGRGHRPRASAGAWGSLSRVTDPYSRAIATTASAPLLDNRGDPVLGGRAIPGAVTIRLAAAQVSQAERPSGLWVQGGVPADPVLAGVHGRRAAPGYGFGALRCAADTVDGGNVERLLFPAGINHVFCYAYYVSSPPVSGTIVIRSEVEGVPPGPAPSFPFSGDISYAPDGFTLQGGRSLAFHRAGGVTWHIAESAVADYRLTSVACRSSAGTSTASTSGMTLSVALAAGDTVHCTFVDRWVPPRGSLTIVQLTEGGTGSFGYIVEPYNDDPTFVTATSRREGVPVNARPEGNLALLATKRYDIQVLPPAHPAGRWTLVGADCRGRRRSIRDLPASGIWFRIVFGKNSVCTFTSRLTPPGSIRLSSVTEGATGAGAFVIESLGSTPRQFDQYVGGGHEGVAAIAAPDAPSDATDHLHRGTYRITEQTPLNAPAGTMWKLAGATCNGTAVPVRQGSITVALSREVPHLSCVFTDRLERAEAASSAAAPE